ncbi:MAG: DUF3426 domain-containing protein, partial [Gammaproteobacteria bacterium]|nr:DUF3426 domain-containing protein [Gammaproteobacteria bacterium]
MFTQCPNCETTFQVTANQLKAANGDVRCGQCLAVFNALDNLSESMEAGPESHGADTDSTSHAQNSTSGDANTSIDKNLEEFFGDLFEDSPDESFDQPITYANPEIPDKDQPGPDSGFFYGANEATIEKILEAEETAHLEPENEAVNEVKSGVDHELEGGIETGIFQLDELAPVEAPLEKSREGESDESLLDLIEKIDVTESNTKPTEPETKVEEKIDSSNVPSVILDELEAAKAQHLKPPSTQWVVASIVLMLVFVLQAVYFSRDSLAKNPTYRPILTSACDLLGCEINIEFDTRLIEIIGRDVRSHPTSKKALIAGTTLINNASYAQPFPLLTLTFSDITGTKLAQRRFTPREYLRSGTDIAAGMPSEIPIQVELHLVDPGKAAVNFEFTPEVDPRS